MIIDIFGSEVKVRDYYCQRIGWEKKERLPSINLILQFEGCNAICDYCELYNIGRKFDFDKFNKIIDELNDKIQINKLSFVGGEPTLQYDTFKKVLEISKEKLKPNLTVLNTNGYRLSDVFEDNLFEYFDSISISRHHYDDDINDEIFKVKTISSDEIRRLQSLTTNKNQISLSCNLIKNYIEDEDSIIKYLEYIDSLGIKNTGFVNLMDMNQYCVDNSIDFNNIDLLNKRFSVVDYCFLGKICECCNCVYVTQNNNVIEIYIKNTKDGSKIIGNIVYNGKDLKKGYLESDILF